MSACNACWQWNLPLAVPSQRLTDGQVIALRFEQWIAWAWHVLHHQKNADGSYSWPGELVANSTSNERQQAA